MRKLAYLKGALIGGASVIGLASAALADQYNIPSGDLVTALTAYSTQTGVELIVSDDAIKGTRTNGVKGELTAYAALSRILAGTGFTMQRDSSGAVGIVRAQAPVQIRDVSRLDVAQTASRAAAGIESVVVTSSKIKGDIQTVPIAITALSQEQLTSRQIAGGPDLVKEVPNLTFTKTNFTGYSIQIRGIGTQAISVTTDPAVAVALNDIPFIRNHFFEQEFYDVGQLEVLRGPQGTLYGRNATAGVVNIISAKPTDQFEAMTSADVGNYHNRRYEGMINIPIVDDRFDIRLAGEWTKRDGYSINNISGNNIDGRDLWSARATIALKLMQNMQATLVWEHFQESDDRMRTAKQLCKTDPGHTSILGIPIKPDSGQGGIGEAFTFTQAKLGQGCLPASLYSPESFEVPNGFSLGYVIAGQVTGAMLSGIDPYASTVQSRNLREIETQIDPRYDAKNNTVEFNLDYNVTPELTFTSQTGYDQDFLWSTEDYNRFNTTPEIFSQTELNDGIKSHSLIVPDGNFRCSFTLIVHEGTLCPGGYQGTPVGEFCDPQLGCSSRLVAQDVSREHAWQLSQEFRLASNFASPLNFSVGGNYMHYETVEDYFVFVNTLTMFVARAASNRDTEWVPNVTDNLDCLSAGFGFSNPGRQYLDPLQGLSAPTEVCHYIDPNNLANVNSLGHNYFLSKNPYVLNSYAGFGEVYYNVTDDVKLTGGLRWTDDRKHFILLPSELLAQGYGYPSLGIVDQKWGKFTGRAAVNWTPKLDFTDQTLVYGSFAHGYKAGGANPPGARLGAYTASSGVNGVPVHPLTFEPEYVNAFELGSKNTLGDGAVTLNGNVFYYDYKGYQISEIVDRTSINLNFDAKVKGAELEASYEPIPGLKFHFAGGYEDTRIADGQQSVDLMDRNAGHAGWVVLKPWVTEASNCILPEYVVATLLQAYPYTGEGDDEVVAACGYAYQAHLDPYNNLPYDYTDHPARGRAFYTQADYHGFDPLSYDPAAPANVNEGLGLPPNNGEGFAKDLSGNRLPNAPRFTTSLSAEYTMPLSEDWAGTLHSDFYWQSQSFARVFNDVPYDKIRGYSNVNLALILTSADGWQVMGYLKNVFDTTAITGTFLNSDDSGLTTNIFLTDPRLYGVRITKNW